MRHYLIKALAFSVMTGTIVTSTPILNVNAVNTATLDTEIAGAGIAVALVTADTAQTDISTLVPEQTEEEVQKAEIEEAKAEVNELFSDVAITSVTGDDYVNVRKKPNVNSKRVGKVYSNCGAIILEETKNGWYKMKSGNVTGYIKAEYFVKGIEAEDYALDYGYVFANLDDNTGIHVRSKATTDSEIVTNAYKNEHYAIKKFSKDGKWAKIVFKKEETKATSGWISTEFIRVSIDMDTAITLKEERAAEAALKAEQEREAAEQAAAAAAAAGQSTSDSSYSNTSSNSSNTSNTSNSSSTNNYSYSSNTGSSTTSSSSGGSSSVVAYAKQFLGNPYVWGGSSLTNGTDCSGFTMSVYAHFGYSLNRSSYTQVNNGTSVSLSSLAPGDLLFYKYGGGSISHVAIYIGGGQIIHASTEETGIIISGMGSPCAARRIIN